MSESTNATINAREAALERARARARAREDAKAAQEAAKNAEDKAIVSNCSNATAALANTPAPKKAMSPRELALMLLKSKASTTAMCRVYTLYLLEVFKGLGTLTTARYLEERSALTALAIFGGRKDLLADFEMWENDFAALYRTAKPEDASEDAEDASEDASEEDEIQFCKDFDEFCADNDFVLPHTEADALAMCKKFAQAQTPYSDNVFCKNISCGQGKNFASFTAIRDAARAQLANLSPSSRGLTEEEREAIRLTQAAQEVAPKTGTHASVLGSCFGDLR